MDYAERVEKNLEGIEHVSEGPCPGCETCGLPEDAEEYDCEPGFSWSACEVCGSSLGGDRHPFHGILDGKLLHLEGCTDCALYIANGQLPDEEE